MYEGPLLKSERDDRQREGETFLLVLIVNERTNNNNNKNNHKKHR